MNNWQTELFKLSGMVYHQAEYSAYDWIHKTGVDPRLFPAYIYFTSEGACIWTAKAERLYQQHKSQVGANWASLGIA